MTVEHSHRAGLSQARKEGIELGLAEGEARGIKLADILLDAGRIDDLKRASNDATYRDALFQEFHL